MSNLSIFDRFVFYVLRQDLEELEAYMLLTHCSTPVVTMYPPVEHSVPLFFVPHTQAQTDLIALIHGFHYRGNSSTLF